MGGGYLGSCGDKIWEWPGNEASQHVCSLIPRPSIIDNAVA